MTGLLSLRSILLLQKGKNMFAKSSVNVIAGILLLSALTGCTGAPEETAKKISPTNPEATIPPFETALDYDAEIVLANNELETQFLGIALASCKKAQTVGFIISDTGQDHVSIFRPSATGMWPDWPFEQVSIINEVPGLGMYDDIYKDYPPSLFEACNLEIQARRGGGEALLEHKLSSSAANSFDWQQHQGGANFEEVSFQVEDGLISSYQRSGQARQLVTYGPLDSEQMELLDQAEDRP
jgi:hypothetical protein